MRVIVLMVLSVSLLGCTSLSSTEKAKIRELEAQGIRVPHETVKHPVVAGALNVLPGFGNFYLAAGTDEGDHWLYGLLNLLTWPASVIWAIPEGAIDATNINKRETVYYYTYGAGKSELESATVD